MADLGPEERELFESSATPLYEEAALSGGLKDDDPRITERRRSSTTPSSCWCRSTSSSTTTRNAVYMPVDPTTVQSHVVGR